MDYEKKYKEALERARMINNGEDIDVEAGTTTCEYIFPELKESEDERISKALIEYFRWNAQQLLNDISNRDVLAWLEKQGKQNPSDTVEPKFKVGNWVAHNKTHFVFKILKITPFDYKVVNHLGYHHTITDDAIENNYHLWTIQDAKDGDVLVASDKSLFIYNGSINENGCVDFHIGFTKDMNIILNSDDGCGWEEKDSCHPATKEQRDFLFTKMTEAGYEWDARKKELRKLQQQKLAWSEGDECYMSECIGAIATKDGWSFEEKRKTKHWLKSLKERIRV